MIRITVAAILVLLSLPLGVLPAFADEKVWEKLNDHGVAAYKQRQFVDAEKSFLSAVDEAGKAPPNYGLLGTSLNNLALVYDEEGRLREAEAVYQRAVEAKVKAGGPNDK